MQSRVFLAFILDLRREEVNSQPIFPALLGADPPTQTIASHFEGWKDSISANKVLISTNLHINKSIMKIISGAEPLFCDINDQSYKILTDISSTSNDNELMQRMRHWMPLNFDSMVHTIVFILYVFIIYLTVLFMFIGSFIGLEGSVEQNRPSFKYDNEYLAKRYRFSFR